LQRLFSTFANGWPGVGLLLQRVATAIVLVRLGIIQLSSGSFSASTIPWLIGASAAILLLVGLWTPVVGALVAIFELWVVMTQIGDPWAPILLATLGGTPAMIGPGAWSIDARLFGRRRLED